MKNLVKVSFAAVVLALLSGCATQTALTKSEDGIINKPVDVRGMKKEWREWHVDGSIFKVQIFIDKDGQYYDEDGVKATKEGYRILANGQVCTPTHSTWLDNRIRKFDNGNLDIEDCTPDATLRQGEKNSMVLAGVLGGGAAVGLIGAIGGATFMSGTNLAVDKTIEAFSDEEKPFEKVGHMYIGRIQKQQTSD